MGDAADDGTGGLSGKIIAAAIDVHRFRPGLLESAYEVCLAAELRHRGIGVARQIVLPLQYRGVHMECGYRLMDLHVGLLLNFNVPFLAGGGIKRVFRRA